MAEKAKECTSLLDKSLGLFVKSNPRCLMFKTRFGIHTLFLKETIDVLVLDKKGKVVKMGNSLRPNSFFFWNPKYNLVIEFPEGTIKKTETDLGDLIVCHCVRSRAPSRDLLS